MELFHWFERWAWRIAVLMPIYQNCTSGHWKHGHRYFSVVGTTFHWIVAAWGCCFFVFQVLFSDVVRFVLFLRGDEVKTLYELLDIASPGIRAMHPFSYHGGLVCMWVMYLVLLLGGFKPFYVSLRSAGANPCTVRKYYGEQSLEPLVDAHSHSGDGSIDTDSEESPTATNHLLAAVV